MTKFITLDSVSAPRQDSKGNEYKQLTFSSTSTLKALDPETGEEVTVFSRPLTASINTYADGNVGPNADLYQAKAGQKFAGNIEQREVDPYKLTGRDGLERDITSYKAVVLGDTTDPGYEAQVEAAFRRNKRPLKGTGILNQAALDQAVAQRMEAVKRTESAAADTLETADTAW